MAIADRLNKLRTDIEDTYQAINEIGGTIPSDKNTNNIPEAIRSVYDNLPKVSDTGTNVSLNPTLKGRLEIVPKGNTYQESTTGKNLFNKYGEFNYGNGNISTRLNSNEQIVSTSNFYVSRSKGQLISDLVANTNYCLSGTIISASGTNSNNVVIQILNTSNQQVKVQTYSSSVTKPYNFQFSFDTGENTSIWISFNGFNNSAEGTTETIFDNVQLEQGSSATSYEPYTGGQPAPNPDYPQEIQSATGTQKVVVSGKNLFDVTKSVQGGLNSVGGYISGGVSSYTITGNSVEITTTQTYRGLVSDYIKVEPNINYSISYNKPTTGVTYFSLFRYYDDSKTYIGNITSSNARYVRFNIGINETGTFKIQNIQLEKGNTATPYQPYQEPQEVDIELSSRNLFDKDNTVVGWIRSNNGTINPESGSHTSNFIKIKPNTNYIRTTREGNAFYDENKEFISYTYGNNYETPNNAKYIRITVTDVNINQEQLEEGTQATDYTPYYNYSLNKIGDYEDYIDGTPDNWVLYKNIGKVVLNGSISFDKQDAWSNVGNNTNAFYKGYTSFDNMKPSSVVMSDNFVYLSNIVTNDSYGIYLTTNLIIRVPKTITNKSELNNWLSTHNVEIIYPLATPTETQITDTNIISQLNELYYLQSYNDTTNIDVTGNLPMRITASAIKGE